MVLGIMVELVETLLSSVRPHMVAVVVANITQMMHNNGGSGGGGGCGGAGTTLLEDQRPLDPEVMLEDMRILHQVEQVQMISIALVAAVVPEGRSPR